MSFTDDDLKRLKDLVEMNRLGSIRIAPEMTVDQLKALLARLEAAECGLLSAWSVEDMLHIPEELGASASKTCLNAIDKFREDYFAWRKAAGK